MKVRAAELPRLLAELGRALPEIAAVRHSGGNAVAGKYHGIHLSSVFQPWRLAASGEIAAWEAYARSHSRQGHGLSPWQTLAEAAVDDELVALDRLCRTVHALNYFARRDDAAAPPLVLNVDARLLHAVPRSHGEFFGRVLSLLGVAPQGIVIDIHTHRLLDLSRMRQILASYRRHGFAVAVNADGMLHARSLAQLLRPDFLFLDATDLAPGILARHAGSLASGGVRIGIKRIESAEYGAAARDAGVDWVQGLHYDLPSKAASGLRADGDSTPRAEAAT